MGDRADHYLMQVIDGKAVSVAGVSAMSTDAQNVNPSSSSFGSVPHILIQNFAGNTAEAMVAYANVWPEDKIISLVDYHNNVIEQSLESFRKLGQSSLWRKGWYFLRIWRIKCLITKLITKSIMA